MATSLVALGPEFQVNTVNGGTNGVAGGQDQPDVAVLADERFAVTYESDYFGSAADTDPIAALFDPDGTTSLAHLDAFNAGALQSTPAVSGRLDGGLGVVFQNARHADNSIDANGPNITYRPVSANGALGTSLAIADFNAGAGHDALQNPAIATLSTGRQVVAFERIWTAGTDHDVFLNVVDAAGTATQFSAANPLDVVANASWQANPSVAAIGSQAIVVFEDGTGTTTASANIRARIFDGASNTLGAAVTIADHVAQLRTADVAAIDDHRYAIVYGDQNDVWARIYDTTSSALSAEVQIDVAGGFALNPQVAGLSGGGFVATWAEWNGSDYDVRARLFGGDGSAIGPDFLVTSLTDSSQFMPTVAVSDHNVLFAWEDFGTRPEDNAPTGVRARVFEVTDDFVVIRGTNRGDRIDADQTVDDESLPSSLYDDIAGRRGNDRLSGEGGDDRLHGNRGKDELNGGAGDDWLAGGLGKNTLIGGPDEDTFAFDSKLGKGDKSDSYAKILDFTEGDTIELSETVFKTLDIGVLSEDAFRDVGEKQTNKTRITYKEDGYVAYDKDGKGGADAVIIAKLVGKPDIDAVDFLVVA